MSQTTVPAATLPPVVVLGAGTMGAVLAALLHDHGAPVTLVDVSAETLLSARDRLRTARPPAMDFPERADDIRTSILTQAEGPVREAGWIIEAVTERLGVKASLLTGISGLVRADAVVTTNTSALPIGEIAATLPDDLRRRFLGVHFFNPPRHLRLVERIVPPGVDPDALVAVDGWLDMLGKTIVDARDGPGFIANRIGIGTMLTLMRAAERGGLAVDEADHWTGPFLDRPKSGIYRLADSIGLDLLHDLALDLGARTGEAAYEIPSSLGALLARGWLGDKTGGGYTRREGREFLVLDLRTFVYRPRGDFSKPSGEPEARILEAARRPDAIGELMRHGLVPSLDLAARAAPLVAEQADDVDRAMRLGFGWRRGPLEMKDSLAGTADWSRTGETRRADGGWTTPRRDPRAMFEADLPVIGSYGDVDLRAADGATLLGWRTKLGILDPILLDDVRRALEAVRGPLVVTGGGERFSAGFDLRYFRGRIEAEDWAGLDAALLALQEVALLLGARPSVAAVRGTCLGGGLELALGCSRIVAARNANLGLPEARLGLLPAGGGTTRMRARNDDSPARLSQTAIYLAQGRTADHAPAALADGFLGPNDEIVANPDHVVWRAASLAPHVPPAPPIRWTLAPVALAGMVDRAQDVLKRRGEMTDHDEKIGDLIKGIIAKCPTPEDALAEERRAFVALCRQRPTVARIVHMIEKKTPLRN